MLAGFYDDTNIYIGGEVYNIWNLSLTKKN